MEYVGTLATCAAVICIMEKISALATSAAVICSMGKIAILATCTVGWVDIGLGNRRFVVSLTKVWEIAKKFLKSIDLYRRGHFF
jgi:hypothetical protein